MHLPNEAPHLFSEIALSLCQKDVAGRTPAALDLFTGLDQFCPTEIRAEILVTQFRSCHLGACAGVRGIPAKCRTIYAIGLMCPGFTSDGALGGIGGDALIAQMTREFSSPLPQRRFSVRIASTEVLLNDFVASPEM